MVKDRSVSNDTTWRQLLIDYDDDQLLEDFGQELLGQGVGFGPSDLARYRRAAVEWLESHASELRDSICGNPGLRSLTDDEFGAKVADAAIIADTISTGLGHPSASIVAVILVRRGLSRFCDGQPPIPQVGR